MAEPVPSVASSQTTVPEPPIFQPYEPNCNPCPCMALDQAAKIIALLEIILHLWNLVLIIVGTILYFLLETRSEFDGTLLVYSIILAFITLVCLILAIFLLFGVKQRSRWKCCVYFIGRLISQIILIIILFVYVTEEAKKKPLTSNDYTGIALVIIIILVGMYILSVVYFFMEQLKFNPTRPVYLVPDQQSQLGVVRPLPYDANGVSAPATSGL